MFFTETSNLQTFFSTLTVTSRYECSASRSRSTVSCSDLWLWSGSSVWHVSWPHRSLDWVCGHEMVSCSGGHAECQGKHNNDAMIIFILHHHDLVCRATLRLLISGVLDVSSERWSTTSPCSPANTILIKSVRSRRCLAAQARTTSPSSPTPRHSSMLAVCP